MTITPVISRRNPGNYATLIAYLAATALGSLRLLIAADGEITAASGIQALLAVLGAFVVWQGAGPRAKLVGAIAIAALQALVPLAVNWGDFASISWQDYIGVLFAALAAAGVLIPNQPLLAAPVSAEGVADVSSLPATATPPDEYLHGLSVTGTATPAAYDLLKRADRVDPPVRSEGGLDELLEYNGVSTIDRAAYLEQLRAGRAHVAGPEVEAVEDDGPDHAAPYREGD